MLQVLVLRKYLLHDQIICNRVLNLYGHIAMYLKKKGGGQKNIQNFYTVNVWEPLSPSHLKVQAHVTISTIF